MKIFNKRVKFFLIIACVGFLFLLVQGWLNQSVWRAPEGVFVLQPRIDVSTTNFTHLRWAPTVDYICQDNYFIFYEKQGDGIFIPDEKQPLARAQAECRPTGLGYECYSDITGLMEVGKSYLFQAYSSRCGDGVERISYIQEYFNAPIQIEAEPVVTDPSL